MKALTSTVRSVVSEAAIQQASFFNLKAFKLLPSQEQHIIPKLIFGIIALSVWLFSIEGLAQTTINNPDGSTSVRYDVAGSYTFTVPAGVTSLTVECWGGGGSGGGSTASTVRGGGGGAGGAYASSVLTVVPAQNYSLSVGAVRNGTTNAGQQGFPSWFGSTTTVYAQGGAGGAAPNGGTVLGGVGSSAASIGAVTIAGASGANGTSTTGGAGGQGANNGGNGGNQRTNEGNGNNGSAPGGGGAGAYLPDGTDHTGGNGARGEVRITYSLPNATGLTITPVKACVGSGATFSISSSNLATDTYTITYNITGTANNIASTTVTVPFTSGSPGVATFATAVLGTAENSVLRITRIQNSSGNYVNLTNNTNFTVGNCRVWYSYQSGNYNNPATWTLDPSGTTYDNGLNLVPSTLDEITILNGLTVTCNVNNQKLTSTTIQGGGTLDLGTTTGHDLGVITGTGLLRIRGTSLPDGNYTDFVGQTGGTIEYYNTGGTLSNTKIEYNNLRMTNSTGNITYVQAGNLLVHGTFEVGVTGAGTVTWQINDNSNTRRTITLEGDLNVGASGRITVGQGNEGVTNTEPHSLEMYGNITNDGIIKFYDPTDSELDESGYGVASNNDNDSELHRNELQGNAVTVTFVGSNNRTVTCNNTTDFYRFVVNKGSGQQAILTVNSSNTNYFRLFGPADFEANLTGQTWEYTSNNALSLVNGTLELTGHINIPFICINYNGQEGYFPIPRNAALWLNGSDVTLQISDNNTGGGNKDGRILISGLLRVTAGTLNDGFSKGLGSQDGGSYLQEGGTVNCWQFRPRAAGTGVFSFTQTGGTLNVGYGYALSGGKIDTYEQQYARFDLRSPNCTFQMSGNAVLNVAKPTSDDANAGLFRVSSTPGNYNVTGGTVNLYMGYKTATLSYTGRINTTAPLYNVNIYEESATTQAAQLASNGLQVLNSLTIHEGNNPVFMTNDLFLTIGGDFIIEPNTTFTPGNSTITFDGAGAQSWIHSGTITSLAGTVVVAKSGGTLTLGGTQTFPDIGSTTGLAATTGGLNISSGTLNIANKTITVRGALSNSATQTGSGYIVLTTNNNGGTFYNPYNYTRTIGGNNGTFANLNISSGTILADAAVSFIVSTEGNQTITGNLQLNRSDDHAGSSTILNIWSHSLTVGGGITSNIGLGQSYHIRTSGLHNAGGLTRYGSSRDGSGDLLFPLGTGTIYTPNSIRVAASTHGTITVRPVSSQHPNVTINNRSLQYYWRVTSNGYAGITSVSHRSYTFSSASLLSGTALQQDEYRQARFDAVNLRWSYNNTTYDAGGTTLIPNSNTGTNWYNITGDQLDGEYTCGHASAFDVVKIYYSRNQGAGPWNWNSTNSWTNNSDHVTGLASELPCATCPVIIGNGTSINHTITITTDNVTCGTLALNEGSTLDCGTRTGLNLGTNTTGRGRLRLAGTFPTGDFLNFLGPNGGTVEWYGNTKTVPNTYTSPAGGQNLNTYYNLILNPSAGQTISLPASNLTVYNNLTQGEGTYTGVVLTNGSARTINVTGNITISAGTFRFNYTSGSSTSINVTGNLINNGTMAVANTTGTGQTNTHTITTSGSITNNGSMDFRTYNAANRFNVVNIIFIGNNNVQFDGSGSGGTTLNMINVNKGVSQTATVTFSTGGTITTTAAADGWLDLDNGTFDFANTGTVTTTLSNDDYIIPSTAKLRVSGENVTVSITGTDANNNDLFLNGSLEITGGVVNVGSRTGTTNHVDLEYAAAGTPTLIVANNGELWVRGSLRRSTAVITGALVYHQSGTSTVTIGGIASNNTTSNTRGVFEIDYNSGSSFTLLDNAQLNIQRQTGGTSYADVYINPVTSNVSPTSTITVGLGTATTQNNLRVYIVPTIGNFSVQNGNGTNAQTVLLYNDLTLGGTLTIPSPSVLNATAVDPDPNVTLAGDFVCGGTYNAGTNTTTFSGANNQSAVLTTSTNFYNVTVNKTAGTVSLSGTAPAAPGLNNLSILSGTLEVGNASTPLSASLKVNRNIAINGSQIGTQAIEVYSTVNSNTITSSNGAFTNLTLGGTSTNHTVNVVGNVTINGVLNFASNNRYLMIGSYEFAFGSAATVTGAGSNKFIRTNGVASDLGVVKTWAAGTSTFNYPIGTGTNYTPVSYSLNVTGAGTLTVVPVNSVHVTYYQAGTERILNYYWSVRRGSTLNATASGNHTYSYPSALISGTGGTLAAGYLDPLATTLGWTTSGHGGSATTTQMTFASTPATNFPPAGSFYDYTVGTPGPIANSNGTLPNPIQPLYSRLGTSAVQQGNGGGNWTTNNSWTTEPDGDPDNSSPAYTSIFSGPRGVPVVILDGARINMDQPGRTAYRTTINGILYSGTGAGVATTGHNLGIISGTGTFRTATNTFPAGNYTAFVSSTGGTIEYEVNATNNPLTMNSVNLTSAPNTVTYNNLTVRLQGVASGVVNMTNDNMILNGNLTLPAGVTLVNGLNRNITIAGNWNNAGTFTHGTGTVTFNGGAAQTITGTTTFNGFTVSKSAQNVTLADPITVNGTLTLTSGHIISSTSDMLQLGTSATLVGGSASSFVAGPARKVMAAGTSFTFPVGSIAANRYRPAQLSSTSGADTWTIHYFGTDPGDGGFPNETYNTANLGTVSNFEYWTIDRTGSASADVTLSYNTGSYRADVGNVGNVANLRVARWNGSQWDLPPGGGTFSQTGTNISGTVRVTNVSSFSPFTLASLDVYSPLPIDLLFFNAKLDGSRVLLNWSTAHESNNHYFTVEKTIDFESFEEVGIINAKGESNTKQNYSLVDSNPYLGRSYYRLKQTDFDGKFSYSEPVMIKYDGSDLGDLSVYPNPFEGQEFTIVITGSKGAGEIPIVLYDQRGQKLYETILTAEENGTVSEKVFFTTPLPTGLYIMKAGRTLDLVRKIAVK